jgi:hypothetical protein
VVLPRPPDLEVVAGGALVAQVELLDHPAAGLVAGHDGDLDPVELQLFEGQAQDQDERLGDESSPGLGLVDPVADVGALERPALDPRQVDLAGQGAVVEEDRHGVGGVEVALTGGRGAAGPEGGGVAHQVGRARLGQRLPRLEPFPVAPADLAPGVTVGRFERPKHHPGPDEARHGRRRYRG